MADLRIVDAPVLLKEMITGDVKMPTGGLGNYAIRLGDLVWYTITKEQLTNKSYVDQQDDLKADKATTYTKDETYNREEVDSKDGDLSTLATTDKTNLVKAINELHDTAKGVVALYDKNVELGAVGWSDTLIESDKLTQRQINDGLDSVNALLAIKNPRNGQRVYVKSYYAGLGNGGSYFVYDNTKANINDGGLVINGWVRQLGAYVNTSMFGVKADGTTDDTPFLLKAISAVGKKNLVIDQVITVKSDVTLPSSINVIVTSNGGFNSADNITLKINAKFNCGLNQCFYGSGKVLFGSANIEQYYPQWWGVKGDGRMLTDGNMSVGSNVLTSQTANFSQDDVGKYIQVKGATVAYDVAVGTITSVTNATTAVVSFTASLSVNNQEFMFATDDTTAINKAITSIGQSLNAVRVQGYNGTVRTSDTFVTSQTLEYVDRYPVQPQGATLKFVGGTYVILGDIRVPYSNITIAGDGIAATRFLATGTENKLGYTIHYYGEPDGILRCSTIKDCMLYTPNYASVRRRFGLVQDYHEHFYGSNVFFNNFGWSALTFLTSWEQKWDNVYILACGADQPTDVNYATGVIHFGSSTVKGGQCNNTKFDGLSMLSNFGHEFLIRATSYTHSNIFFNNIFHENHWAEGGAVMEKERIVVHNSTNVVFSKFAFVMDATDVDHSPTFVRTFTSDSADHRDMVTFENGTILINVSTDEAKPVGNIFNITTRVALKNVEISDISNKTDFIFLASGGEAEFVFDNCVVKSPKSFDNLFYGSPPISGELILINDLKTKGVKYNFNKLDIYSTASLPLGSFFREGLLVLEDTGSVCNLVAYKGGSRYRFYGNVV